jgi:protein TonB
MDTRIVLHTRRRARGAVRPVFIAIIAVIALLAVGAWFFIIQPHEDLMLSDSGGHLSTPVAIATKAAPPPPADVASMDVNQLLGEARKAINEQRYLAPKGNNAFEFYLRVLEKQPGNPIASDAMRETFPYAANSAEQAINARNFDDAQRQIDLLTKADPTNFTLTILRSKLDAQHKVLDKQQQQAADQQKAQELAAQKAAADKLAADKLAAQQKVVAAEEPTAQPAPVAPQAGVAEASKPSASGATAAAGEAAAANSDAVLLKGAAPVYPRDALRTHQTGWVIVSFSIDPDGHTSNVHVTDAQPRRVFDRAATDAVGRYRFTPAMKNGQAVAITREQKIEFSL